MRKIISFAFAFLLLIPLTLGEVSDSDLENCYEVLKSKVGEEIPSFEEVQKKMEDFSSRSLFDTTFQVDRDEIFRGKLIGLGKEIFDKEGKTRLELALDDALPFELPRSEKQVILLSAFHPNQASQNFLEFCSFQKLKMNSGENPLNPFDVGMVSYLDFDEASLEKIPAVERNFKVVNFTRKIFKSSGEEWSEIEGVLVFPQNDANQFLNLYGSVEEWIGLVENSRSKEVEASELMNLREKPLIQTHPQTSRIYFNYNLHPLSVVNEIRVKLISKLFTFRYRITDYLTKTILREKDEEKALLYLSGVGSKFPQIQSRESYVVLNQDLILRNLIEVNRSGKSIECIKDDASWDELRNQLKEKAKAYDAKLSSDGYHLADKSEMGKYLFELREIFTPYFDKTIECIGGKTPQVKNSIPTFIVEETREEESNNLLDDDLVAALGLVGVLLGMLFMMRSFLRARKEKYANTPPFSQPSINQYQPKPPKQPPSSPTQSPPPTPPPQK